MIHNSARTDRWTTFQKEVEQQGIVNVIQIPAVLENKKPASNISKAHKNCIRYALAKKLEQVIILEDDVCFTDQGAFQHFLNLIPSLPPLWNIFLGGVYDGNVQSINENIGEVTDFSGLHCYAVHSRFYQRFLEANESLNLDKWLSKKKWGNTLCHVAYPMIAIQHDGWSDNVQMCTDYNPALIKKRPLWKNPQ